eukprot:SAG11_NODE_15038_length_591_cov_0.776423_1_plen_42_part_10
MSKGYVGTTGAAKRAGQTLRTCGARLARILLESARRRRLLDT